MVRDGGARYEGRMRRHGIVLAVAVVGVVVCVRGSAADAGGDRLRGEGLYRRYCASCHGVTGRGDGPDAARFVRRPRDLRSGVLQRYSEDDLVARIRSGRTLALEVDPEKLEEVRRQTEALVQHLRRLAAARWPAVDAGWALYTLRCVACHGSYGRPPEELPAGVRTPRDLSHPAWQRSVSDAELLRALQHGKAGMPALVPRIREQEARALLAFVRLLSPGFEMYQRWCAACHGDHGRGVQGVLGAAEKLPDVRFDRAYFAARNQDQVRQAVQHMLRTKAPAMPHFGTLLDEEQVRDILRYLEGLQ